jgi:hypothetical protein
MVNPTTKDLLQQWSVWLLKQDPDAGGDVDGSIVAAENAENREIWFIPGTWGRIGVAVRKIAVPAGRQLFVVAGSSHATVPELASGQAGEAANLKSLAEDIDKRWLQVGCQIGPKMDNLQNVNLDKATTDIFNVNINPGNGYAALTQIAGPQQMVTTGRCFLYTPPKGTSYLVIGAQAPKNDLGKNGEKEYNVQVTYEVTVN